MNSNFESQLLVSVMRPNLDEMKNLIPHATVNQKNVCLAYLGHHNCGVCLEYLIPLADPTYHNSEALRNAVYWGNPTSIALLWPVSAQADREDVFSDIIQRATQEPTDEWVNAVSQALTLGPRYASLALMCAIQNDCSAIAHIVYPHVTHESIRAILKVTEKNSAYMEIQTRLSLSNCVEQKLEQANHNCKKM